MAWVDEGLGKGPVVGAIGIGTWGRLEVEGEGGVIIHECAIEMEGPGDVGEGDGYGCDVLGYAGDGEGQFGEDMVDGHVDVVTGLGGKDGEGLLTQADIGEGVEHQGR